MTDPRAESVPIRIRQYGALGERYVTLSMNTISNLADHHYLASHCFKQIKVWLNGFNFLCSTAFKQIQAVPARYQNKSIFCQ